MSASPEQLAFVELYDALMRARGLVLAQAQFLERARRRYSAAEAFETLERVDGALANAADYRRESGE